MTLLRKLQRHVELPPQACQDLLAAFDTPRSVAKGAVLADDYEASVAVLLEGLAFSSRASASGRSQTVALHLPGDILNLQGFILGAEGLTIRALTRGRVASIGHGKLKRLMLDHPRLAHAIWGGMVAETAIAHEWIYGLGQRSALQNMAHFICELRVRFEDAGLPLASGLSFDFSQERLAQVLGLSTVHINRTLQQLRGAGVIRLSRTTLTILNPEGLQKLGEFDDAYLNPTASTLLRTMDSPSPLRSAYSRDGIQDGAASS